MQVTHVYSRSLLLCLWTYLHRDLLEFGYRSIKLYIEISNTLPVLFIRLLLVVSFLVFFLIFAFLFVCFLSFAHLKGLRHEKIVINYRLAIKDYKKKSSHTTYSKLANTSNQRSHQSQQNENMSELS